MFSQTTVGRVTGQLLQSLCGGDMLLLQAGEPLMTGWGATAGPGILDLPRVSHLSTSWPGQDLAWGRGSKIIHIQYQIPLPMSACLVMICFR